MRDPDDQPGTDDPAIEHATHAVVETWQDATAGKEPTADAGDFARMRDGFAELGAGDGADDAEG